MTDKSKFGYRMLQKMGWSDGKGLGVNEDGTKEHIKISKKDNTLGKSCCLSLLYILTIKICITLQAYS